jgi:hypothetical protein
MVELGVTGAKEFKNTYGHMWWEHEDFDGEGWDDSEEFFYKHMPSLVKPENGDICFLVSSNAKPKNSKRKGNIIYRLIRVKDNGEFIMGGYGFEPYIENKDNINESEDFDWIDLKNFKFEDVYEKLKTGTKILISGDICDGSGEDCFTVNREPFLVQRGERDTIRLWWINSEDRRPKRWWIHSVSMESVNVSPPWELPDNLKGWHIDSDSGTFDYDKDWVIEFS